MADACSDRKMKVAALQLCAQCDVNENLRLAELWVGRAAEAGAQLVVLPEGFSFLGADEDKRHCAEELRGSGRVMTALRSWATRHAILLIAGGLPERVSEEQAPPYNTSVAVGPDGGLVGIYRKMHLFDVDLDDGTRLTESKATTPGHAPNVLEWRDLKIGMSICYDVRFPELYAYQRAQGAHILTIPAAFTRTTGEAHWHVLLRARAIETQCFVVAAAREGRHPRGRTTYGHAMVVDPWGRVLSEVTQGGLGMAMADIDCSQMARIRTSMPLERHRHPFFSAPGQAETG